MKYQIQITADVSRFVEGEGWTDGPHCFAYEFPRSFEGSDLRGEIESRINDLASEFQIEGISEITADPIALVSTKRKDPTMTDVRAIKRPSWISRSACKRCATCFRLDPLNPLEQAKQTLIEDIAAIEYPELIAFLEREFYAAYPARKPEPAINPREYAWETACEIAYEVFANEDDCADASDLIWQRCDSDANVLYCHRARAFVAALETSEEYDAWDRLREWDCALDSIADLSDLYTKLAFAALETMVSRCLFDPDDCDRPVYAGCAVDCVHGANIPEVFVDRYFREIVDDQLLVSRSDANLIASGVSTDETDDIWTEILDNFRLELGSFVFGITYSENLDLMWHVVEVDC